MPRSLQSLVAAMLVLAAPRAAYAAPEVQFLFPAGGQRGQTVSVTATGKFAAWPVKVHCDRPGLEVTAGEEKGSLAVQIAADAEPVLYWLRLYDETGSAAPRPFVVGIAAEAVEKEPNNEVAAAQAFDGTVTVNGQLGRGGDVDTFAIAAKAGQILVADLDAQAPLGSPVDAVVQIVSPDGFVLAQNDDQMGLDPRVVAKIPADGDWRVRVFGFPADPNQSIALAGSNSYVYRLTMTAGAFVDYAMPLAVSAAGPTALRLRGWNLPPDLERREATVSEGHTEYVVEHPVLAGVLRLPVVPHASLAFDNASVSGPQTVPWPATITGRVAAPRERDEYLLDVKQGDMLAARVESRTLGFDLDPVLELIGADGKQLARVDDTGNSRDAELSATAAADGQFRLIVDDLHRDGGERFVYRLTLERYAPDFRLTCDSHQLVIAPGATADLPVTIERKNGLAQPIALSVEGLPAGVTVAEAVSQPEGDTAAKVTLKFTAAADAPLTTIPLKVVGRVDSMSRVARVAVPEHPQAELSELWLTIGAATK